MKLSKIWTKKHSKLSRLSLYIGDLSIGLSLIPVCITLSHGQTGPSDIYGTSFNGTTAQTITAVETFTGVELVDGSSVTVDGTGNDDNLLTGNPHVLISDLAAFQVINSDVEISSLISSSPNSTLFIEGSTVTLNLTPLTSSETIPGDGDDGDDGDDGETAITVGQNDTFAGSVEGVSNTEGQFGRLVVSGQNSASLTEFQTFTGEINLSGAGIDGDFDSNLDFSVTEDDFNFVVGPFVGVTVEDEAFTNATSVFVDEEGALTIGSGEIVDLLVEGLMVDATNLELSTGLVTVTESGDTFEIVDSAQIDGVVYLEGPSDVSVIGGINIGNVFDGTGEILANGNDVVIANTRSGSTSIDIRGSVDLNGLATDDTDTTNVGIDLIKLGTAAITFDTQLSHAGATWIAGGEAIYEAGSNTTEVIVSGRLDSAEAVGNEGDGGAIYNDNFGNAEGGNLEYEVNLSETGEELLFGRQLSTPTLTIRGAFDNVADFTVGAATNENSDIASVVLEGEELLNDAVDFTIYNGGNLSLLGTETVSNVIFADAANSSNDATITLESQTDVDGNPVSSNLTVGSLIATADSNAELILNDGILNITGVSNFDGSISGADSSQINVDVDGEVILTDAGADNLYDFTGTYSVIGGALHIENSNILTDASDVVVSNGGEVQYVTSGAESFDNSLTLSGFGADVTADSLISGALRNDSGSNTQTGAITLSGDTAFFASDGSELIVNSTITGSNDSLFTAGGGSIVLESVLNDSIDDLYQNGTGSLDLGNLSHEFAGNLIIENGVVIVSSGANAVSNVIGGADIVFTGDSSQDEAPEIQFVLDADEVLTNTINIDSSQSQFGASNDPLESIAAINVSDNVLTADLDNLNFADPSSALYQTGAGTLLLDGQDAVDNNDVVIDGILNASNGTLSIEGDGTDNLLVNGLGAVDDVDFITSGIVRGSGGTISLIGFDSITLTQTADTTFEGALDFDNDLDLDFIGNGNSQTFSANSIADSSIGDITVADGTLGFTASAPVDVENNIFVDSDGVLEIAETGASAVTLNGDLTGSGELNVDGILNLPQDFELPTLSGTGTLITDSITIGQNTLLTFEDGIIEDFEIQGNLIQEGGITFEVDSLANSDTLIVSNGAITLDPDTAILTVIDDSIDNALDERGATTNVISATTINGGFEDIVGVGTALGTAFTFDTSGGDVISLGQDFESSFDDISTADVDILDALSNSLFGDDFDDADFTNFDGSSNAGQFFIDLLTNSADLADSLASVNPIGYIGTLDYALLSLESYSISARQAVASSKLDVRGNYYGYYDTAETYLVEVFGGYNDFTGGSDIPSFSNYDIDGTGGYAGVRFTSADESFKVGGFFAVDEGDVTSQEAATDIEVTGFLGGLFADYQQNQSNFAFHGDFSIGTYNFEGNREISSSLVESNFDSTAIRFGVSADYLLYNVGGLRLIPTIGITSLTTDTDEFTEGDFLSVSDLSASSLLLDTGVRFDYFAREAFVGINGYVGYQYDFEDTEREVTANFGQQSFTVGHSGADEGAFVYNVGAYWNLTSTFRINANYFGESRSRAQTISGVNAGAIISF